MRLSSAPHCGHDECARPLAASAPFYFETFALHLVVRDEKVFDLRDEVLAEITQLEMKRKRFEVKRRAGSKRARALVMAATKRRR